MQPMSPLAQSTNTIGDPSRTGRGFTGPPLDEEGLCVQLRAYLECRSRHVDPPPPLVEAWDRFYDLYTPRIRAFFRRFRLSAADREDCLQDVWSKVLTRLTEVPYDPRRARLSPWLITVARNLAIDALRRRRRLAAELYEEAFAVVDAGPGPDAACDRLALQARVRDVLTELSARAPAVSFQVLYLHAIDGRTNAEVAETLGLTPEQVRFRLHRMMRKFRDLFERSGDSDRSEGEESRPPDGEQKISRNTAGPRAYNY
jgi:RNA polymerase sigma-70 factor (ECF subfamily)